MMGGRPTSSSQLTQKKAFDKIQFSFYIKTLKELRIEGNSTMIKAICEQVTTKIILNSERLVQECILSTSFNTVLEILTRARGKRGRKEKRRKEQVNN